MLASDAYCFFKISIRPAFVKSLPLTARLKSSITSGATMRFDGLDILFGFVIDVLVGGLKPSKADVW